MKAWIIESPTGVLIPAACGRTRTEAISLFLEWVDWILFPEWNELRKEGFKPVKVDIQKVD
jgi:hypothetical protein